MGLYVKIGQFQANLELKQFWRDINKDKVSTVLKHRQTNFILKMDLVKNSIEKYATSYFSQTKAPVCM